MFCYQFPLLKTFGNIIVVKSLYFQFKQLVIFAVRVFFSALNDGSRCLVCNKKTLLVPLCRNCLRSKFDVSKSVSVKRCKYCGKELISTVDSCMRCRTSPIVTNADRMLPLFSYRLWNKELLFKWKISEERCLSPVFARFIFQALEKLNCRILVPVPPRKGKIKKKGWDQIDDLCQFLEKRYGITVLRLLERRSVKQQKKLNREERIETIKNAYGLAEESLICKELVKNQNKMPEEVCLLDDVCTTGSTIEGCAEILKKAGVREVKAITLFIVD